MSVKEVAYAAGYEHPSSFIRAFRHRFSQTPRSYRLGTRGGMTQSKSGSG